MKAGTSLNFEAKNSYDITVTVDDVTIGDTFDASVVYTLTINNVNESPIVDEDKIITVLEDSGETLLNINQPTDVDGDNLTITIDTIPDSSQGNIFNNGVVLTVADTLTLDELTNLVFTPVENANGEAGNLTYTVFDGVNTVSQTTTINITPVNDSPTLTIPTLPTISEATNFNITGIIVNDIDAEIIQVTLTINNGVISLSYLQNITLINGTGNEDDTVTIQGTIENINTALDSLVYRSNLNFEGIEGLEITVNDLGNTGEGGVLEVSETLNITVKAVNQPPDAEPNKLLTVDQDSGENGLNIPPPTDPDNDTLTITITEIPDSNQGIVTLNNNPVTINQTLSSEELQQLVFIPANGVTGSGGIFSYSVEDGQGGSDSQTITFNISPVIILREEDNFKVVHEESIIIPETPSKIRFTYESLNFDVTDTDFINDAFEVALLGNNGESLVYTIDTDKDTFFNTTEEQGIITANGVEIEGNTVTLDVGYLPANTQATLIFRLVNNDSDTETSVRISGLEIVENTNPITTGVTPNTPASNLTNTLNFAVLEDVSNSAIAEYKITSFDEKDKILSTDVNLRNIGTYGLNGSIIVAIANISHPSIRVINADGITPQGLPYYDFTTLLNNGKLDPEQISQSQTFNFRNPQEIQFTYDLVILAEINQPPVIESTPTIEIIGGKTYEYDVNATDINGDNLTYSLTVSPEGMTIDSQTGQITWETTIDDIANHQITIEVSDERGEIDTQTYNLSVISEPPNRPPLFTTSPIVDAYINQLYQYDADAIDPDLDPLSFSLILGPDGMTVNSQTGVVEWTPPPVLVLGDTVFGQIGIPGEKDEFTFSGVLGQEIYFDPLQFTGSRFDWNFEVYSPSGQRIINTDLQSSNNQIITLTETGNYRIVVDANSDVTGSYGFRVIDVNLTPVIPVDTVIENQLSPGSEDDIYRFTGNKGQKLFLDSLGSNGSLNWVLYDPDNKVVTSSSFSDRELYLPTDGEYKLAIRGTGSLTDITTYSFEIITPDEITRLMNLGSNENLNSVFGEITEKGEEDFYTFTGTTGQKLYFDRLYLDSTATFSHTVNITSPSGRSIFSDNLYWGDGDTPFSLPEDGTYQVRIDASGENTGSYSFNILDVGLATPIDLDTDYSGTLSLGQETHFYQFEGTEGQRIFIDSPNDLSGANWTVYDSGNKQVASTSISNAIELVLDHTDTYTLAIKGNNGTTPVDYSFQIITPDIVTQSLTLDTNIVSEITEKGEQDIYTFQGTKGQRLFLDTLIDRSDFRLTLLSPSGTNLNSFTQMYRDDIREPFILPETGNYQVIADGSAEAIGDYGFKLIDVDASPTLSPEILTGNQTLDPGKSIQFYQFVGNKGERIYFDNQENSPNTNWVLYTASNQELREVSLNSDFEYVLPHDGTYFLMLRGERSDGTVPYNIQFVPTTTDITPLTINNEVNGDISKLGEQDIYTFNGTVGQTLHFEPRGDNSNFTVTLNSPSGQQIFNINGNSYSNPIILREGGTYQLRVDGNNDNTGSYNFVISDAGLPLTFGTVFDGNLEARNTILYQFEGTAGQQLNFDSLNTVSGLTWGLYSEKTLLNGSKNIISRSSLSDFNVTLPIDITYTLVLQNTSDNDLNYEFQVNDISPSPSIPGGTFDNNLSLTEINDYVAISNFAEFPSTEFTIEGWFQKLDSNGFEPFVSYATTEQENELIIGEERNNTISVYLKGRQYTTNVIVPDNEWYHWSFSWSSSDGQLNIYLDGVEVFSDNVAQGDTLTSGGTLILGQEQDSVGGRFDNSQTYQGKIDDFRIWNVQRTQQEIQTTYNQQLTGNESGLVTYFNFNNIEDNVVIDATGNNQGIVYPLPLEFNTQVNVSLNTLETKTFKFTGTAGQKIWLDGLNASNPSITARLLNSSGRQIASLSDLRSDIGLQTLEADGDYYLVLQSNNNEATTASFKLLDNTNAIPTDLDTEISGDFGENTLETRFYRFNGTEGQRLYFDRTDGDFWNSYYIYDPSGQQLFSQRFHTDYEGITLVADGEYIFVVQGTVNASNNHYNLTIVTPEFLTNSITIDEIIDGEISEPGEQDTYTFNATIGQQLWLDELLGNSNLTATLYSPSNRQIFSTNFGSLDYNTSRPILAENGTYRLVIDGTGETTEAYRFRLLDFADGTQINLDEDISGDFGETGREAHIYRFNGTEGQRLYFDRKDGDFWNNYYVYDSSGQRLFSQRLHTDYEGLTLAVDGEYTLVFEGDNRSNNNYQLEIVTPEFITETLILGETIEAEIREAGEQDIYTFNGTIGQQLWLDELLGSSSIYATLYSPTGTEIFDASFSSLDDSSNRFVLAESGTYRLVIDGTGDTKQAYSFRLLDFADGTQINLDEDISGNFGETGREAHIYRFNGNQGQRLYFDRKDGDFWNNYYVYDPSGQRLFSQRLHTDYEGLTLAIDGEYTLVFQGDNRSNNNYNIEIVTPEFITNPLTLGDTIETEIREAGEQDTYTFEGTIGQQLWLDELIGDGSIVATLYSPSNTQVLTTNFGSYDDNSNRPVLTENGTYRLVIDGTGDTTQAYSFRLSDFADAPLIDLDTDLSGDFGETQQEAHIYRFNGTKGQRLYFDRKDGDSRNYYYVYDSSGQRLFSRQLDRDNEIITLELEGDYTIVLEGIQSATNNNYNLEIVTPNLITNPLTLGETIESEISQAGERDTYTFDGTTGQQLFFDGLVGNTNLDARLYSPSGALVIDRDTSSDWPLFTLTENGTYRLEIDGLLDTIGNYAFTLSDRSLATPLTFDEAITGTLEPNNETILYQITGSKGTILNFDLEATRWNGANWTLYNPNNGILAQPSQFSPDFEVALPSDGLYTLAIAGNSTTPIDYSFQVTDNSVAPIPITGTNITVTGTVANPGDVDSYTFNASAGTLIWIDQLSSNSSNIRTRLKNPDGTYSFTNHATTNDRGVIRLEQTGEYTLETDGRFSTTTGNWQFQILELPTDITSQNYNSLPSNTVVEGTLNPGSSTEIYSFDAQAGEQILFNGMIGNSVDVRIIDPNGQNIYSDNNFSYFDSPIFNLTQTGIYHVLIDGDSSSEENYAFQLLNFGLTQDIPYNIEIEDTLTSGQESKLYRIEGEANQRLFFNIEQGSNSARIKVLNQNNQNILGNTTLNPNNSLELTLPNTGEYTVYIEGGSSSTPIDYQFQIFPFEQTSDIVTPGDGETAANNATGILGTFPIQIQVEDGRGGQAIQDYNLRVLPDPNNGSPAIISSPDTKLGLNQDLYSYQLESIDPDGDKLRYRLLEAPLGAIINQDTGELIWLAEDIQPGESYQFSVEVSDGRGGSDTQTWEVETFEILGKIQGLVFEDLNANGIPDSNVVVGDQPDIFFVIDVSGSMGSSTVNWSEVVLEDAFKQNLSPLDQELGAILALSEFMIDQNRGDISIGIITSGRDVIDMNPTLEGVQVTTTPITDSNNNGIADIREVITGGVGGGASSTIGIENAWNIQQALPGDPNIFFMSDGFINVDEQLIADVRADGVNLLAFGFAEQGMDTMRLVDPGAVYISSPEDILNIFSGFDPRYIVEPLLEGITVYLDLDNNGQLDDNEPWQVTKKDPSATLGRINYYFSFDDLEPGTYTVRQAVPSGFIETAPESGSFVDTITVEGGETYSHFFGIHKVSDPPNQKPTFTTTAPTDGVEVGEWFRYQARATDPDNDAITYELAVAPEGMTIDPETGLIQWLPTQLPETKEVLVTSGFNQFITVPNTGPVDFEIIITAKDGQGQADLQYFKLTVSPVNADPVFISIPPQISPQVGKPFEYQAQAVDADEDSLTYQLSSNLIGLTIDATTGLLTWTPTTAQVGDNEITILVNDGKGGQDQQTLNLTVIDAQPNNAPEITSNPPIQTRVNNVYVYQVVAEDIDGDRLTYTLTNAPNGMTIDEKGRITWETDANDLGEHPIDITVDDGQGGLATQSFTLSIRNQVVNQPPTITSTPQTRTNTERLYQYQAQATDPDGDYLLWSLDQSPQGMVINPETGVLSWQPTPQQIGSYTIVLSVIDPLGQGVTQTFDLVVTGSNTPALIVSTPGTQASVDQPYTYQVAAQDPENDSLRFSLGVRPDGMIIDATTGLIEWTPTTSQQGSHSVEVIIADTQEGITRQTYTVEVGTTVINQAPSITSNPSFLASLDDAYTYQVEASDPDNDALTFQLLTNPTGMTIDTNTGLIEWTPQTGQVGNVQVSVAAFDTGGLGAIQTYTLQVQQQNSLPIISNTSNPPASAVPGVPYRYDVKVSDPDGEPLTYSLTQAPDGMEIDELGRITWTPDATNLGVNPVEITITDSRGGTVTQTFNITVAADNQAPEIILNFDRDRANIAEQITFQILARDNVAVDELRLTFNGQNLALDGNARATVTLESAGTFEAIATATDNAGNSTSDSITITGIDPSDVDAPIVSITSLSDGDVITAPTDIIGTVTDDNLTSYRLEIATFGDNNFREIASGTNSITDNLLGEFDPSILLNDSYILRLVAEDAGGNTSIDQVNVSVEGELKIGNYQLSFTDLTVPLTGIPIILTRTYDSHNAQNIDDFGYGWRMELKDTDLRTSVPQSGLEDILVYNPFFDGARVYITLPGGQREGFTFQPQRAPGLKGSFLGIWQPKFVPDADVTSELTVQNFDLFRTKTGEYLGFASSLGYNPSNSAFGGTYTLTTKEGIIYEIDGDTGDTKTVRDRNGNELTFTDGGVFSSTGQEITFERDAQNRITAVIDPNGNRIEYGYDDNGDLTTVTDREGNVTRFVYDDVFEHYLEEIIDPLGRTGARSEYDDQGRLTKIIDADGQAVELIHNPNNFVQTIKDQLGNETVYEYDTKGNVLTEIDARGGVITRTYDEQNNMLTETDALGNTTTFTYDNRANVLTETDPLGNITRYTYNSFGDVLTTTDPLGNTVSNTYDRNGNLTSISGYSNETTTFNYDRNGNLTSYNDGTGTTTFEYDGSGNITREIDAQGNETTYTYDANGNQLTQTQTMTTPDGVRTLVTTTEYDAENRVIKITDPENGVTETIYDAVGNLVETIDPLGRSTKYVYNERGELIETIYPDSTPDDDIDNPRTRTEYDAEGQVIAKIDELGRTTQFLYDSVGKRIATIFPDSTPDDDADNPRTRTEYDLVGRITTKIDQRGNITHFEYDQADRIITTFLPDDTPDDDTDNPRLLNAYDASGRQISETDPLGQITRFLYDDLGRLIGQTFADGTSISSEYNQSGRLISRTDQAGQTTSYEYDSLGRLTAVIDALNNRTEYTYDELGNLIAQKDANGNLTQFEYDGLNRRIATELALGQRSTSTYDAVGNLLSTTDFNGETITYEYDERNRLIAKNFPDLTDTTMTYTLNGLRATVTDERGTTTYQYDERDRFISRIDPDGTEISYTYDEARNRTAVTIPSGTTTYTYDSQNRLKTVTDDENGVTTYTYNAASYLIQTDFPNGTVERREYDELNRLIYLETKDSNGTVISSFRYTLDETGNRTAVEEQDGRRVEYKYDDLYRLIKETIFEAGESEASRKIEYTYDDVGNRLSRVDSGDGTTIYTYDRNDRLLTEDKDGIGTSYIYDNNGNTISKTTGTETVTYDWDVENRLLASDTDGDGVNDVESEYDVDGVRVAQTVNGEETRFLIDTNRPYAQVLEEYTDGGIIKVSSVHGHDLISQERNDAQSFYHVDGLGSTRALTNESGLLTDSYIYDAFGQVLKKIGDTENSYLFSGEQRDSNLGLDYLRARYLNVNTGRFISRDPFEGFLQNPITLNKYIYANANPVSFVDPTGNFSLLSLNTALKIRIELAEAFSISGLQAVKRSAKVAAFILEPAAILQEVGLLLIGSNNPGGFGVYNIGRQMSAIGFKAISSVLLEIYRDTFNKLIEDEFEFEDFDEKLEELIEEVQSFINSNNLREFVKDGRGGEELAEGVERLTDFAQEVIDRIA